jgi:tRNA(Arg) A34 adenosine deaminase TadA
MNEFMKVAIELSEENLKTKNGGPFGACVVKEGKIVGKGSNHVIGNNDPTAHAEVMAIRDACKNLNTYDLSDCEIYTTSYPCPMCLSAIIWSNIKKVYYGNTREDADEIGFRDEDMYECIQNSHNPDKYSRILKLECIDREETIKTFEAYKEEKDKVEY